jgi:hypothetical protein
VNLDNYSALQQCYERLKKVVNGPLESFEIVREVQKYREYWKPDNVKLVLLAESHVFTTEEELQSEVDTSALDLQDYPNRFVRFVYCLGYGENSLLNQTIANNPGSRSFWKIFLACCNPIKSNDDFHPVMKTKSGNKTLPNKVHLLNEIKQRGIWLLDASIIGVNGDHRPPKRVYREVISICWEYYIKDIMNQITPENVIFVGAKVSEILKERAQTIISREPTTVPLLNAHLTATERLAVLKTIYSVCNQEYSPSQDTSDEIEPAWHAEKILGVSTDMKDIPGKDTIRKLAHTWLADRCKKVHNPFYCSKYYQAKESWTKAPAWWIEIPEKVLISENCKYVYLLLQKKPHGVTFYCMQVPISYLYKNKENLKFNKNKISLFLSAEDERIFCDQKHNANIAFSEFLVKNDQCQ